MESKYIQFPVSFLPYILSDKQRAINNILNYGLYGYSKLFEYKIEDVARQTIYLVYRGNIKGFRQMLDEVGIEWIGLDEDYNGFSGDTFNPEDEINEMLELFETYAIIKELAIEIYQMHMVYQSLRISGNIEATINEAKRLFEQSKKGDSMAMVKTKILFDFRDNKKSVFEIEQFLAYCSIKSIIGKKTNCKTNWKLVVSRMLGFKKREEVNLEAIKSSPLYKYVEKRYWWSKLAKHLELYWNVKFYSRNERGFNVCDGNKMTYEQLADKVESKKKRIGGMPYKKSNGMPKPKP